MKRLNTLVIPIGLLVTCHLLTACQTFEKKPNQIQCGHEQTSCHHGRFGLVWRIQQNNEPEQTGALSGTYEWRSGIDPKQSTPASPYELATLEVNSTLGPSLGQARRNGHYYEVRAADGRVYLAHNWQALFNLMFPLELPANALVEWMKNPNPDTLPELPPHWEWQNQNGRYRILFVQNNTSGRIDLIPQGALEQ